jgi:hypothetical protein
VAIGGIGIKKLLPPASLEKEEEDEFQNFLILISSPSSSSSEAGGKKILLNFPTIGTSNLCRVQPLENYWDGRLTTRFGR